MPKYLITGGAGFIGSNLVKILSQYSDNTIVSLDNYSTGTEENHIEGVRYVRADTSDINNILDFIPDVVYHLGEYSRVEQSYVDIDKVWEANVFGTYEVLKFCRTHKAKLIYAGSSTKFSDYLIGEGHSPYGWTKASNTDLVQHFGDWFDLKFAIVYFYNVFGRNEIENGKYATVIAKFKSIMKNDSILSVVKPGSQKRNFTHIDDVVKGLQLVERYGSGDGYAIGSEKSYSILEIAEAFGGQIKFLNERPGNRMSAGIDTLKMQALGWKADLDIIDYIDSIKKTDWTDDGL